MGVPGLPEALKGIRISTPQPMVLESEPALVTRIPHTLAKRLKSGQTTGITIGAVAAGILLIIFGGYFLRRMQLRHRKDRARLGGRKREIGVEI